MKIIVYLIALTFLSQSIRADYVTLISTNAQYSQTLLLGTNEMARPISSHTDPTGHATVEIDYGHFKYSVLASHGSISNIVGPASIRIIQPLAIGKSAVGFEVKREASAGQPSTAVVIPDDGAGPVQIVLESSTDLVTWTAANPGSYATSTQKRFFRIRATRQP